MALFGRRGKVFSPEWYLIYFAKRFLPSLSGGKSDGSPSESGGASGAKVKSKSMVAPMGEPTRVAGVLYDPSSGERLSDRGYEVSAEGEPYHSGRTDGDGAYSFIFTPSGGGVYHLEVTPEGFSEPAKEIKVEAWERSEPSSASGKDERTVSTSSLKTGGERGDDSEEGKESEDKYVYELFPTNFVNLPMEEQNRVVDDFRNLMNSLDCEFKIVISRSSKEVDVGGETVEPEFFKFYIVSDTAVDTNLDSAGFLYQRTTESPEPEVVRPFKSYVAVEGGRTQKTGAIHGLPEQLVEGFPAELYSAIDRMTISIDPIEQGHAVAKMENFMSIKQGIARSGSSSEQTAEAERAREALERLSQGSSNFFEVMINVTAGGDTEEEMNKNYERIESSCKGRMVRVDDPMFAQEEMLRGEEGKELFMDTVTLGAFFPFVSAEVMESPGGTFLGLNRITGGPVIYDPLVRSNGHMALIGKSGSGKSFAAKTYLTRLFDRHPEMAFFVVDPENEYTRTAVGLDPEVQVRHITQAEDLGLDPFRLFKSKDVILHMLTDAMDIGSDEPELLSELRKGVQTSASLENLRDGAGETLAKRLEGLLEGPEGFLFRGESEELSERAVFNLEDLHQALEVSDESVGTLHLASLLVFGQIWQKIQELPQDKLKVVVVDEVWLYTAIPAAASFLEHVSRRGRKSNIVFVLASQRPADVLRSEKGRAAIENCSTKVILQQDEAAADLVRDSFNLTEREIRSSMEFEPGQAILTADNVKAPLKFIATEREYNRFTTKPGEVKG